MSIGKWSDKATAAMDRLVLTRIASAEIHSGTLLWLRHGWTTLGSSDNADRRWFMTTSIAPMA